MAGYGLENFGFNCLKPVRIARFAGEWAGDHYRATLEMLAREIKQGRVNRLSISCFVSRGVPVIRVHSGEFEAGTYQALCHLVTI